MKYEIIKMNIKLDSHGKVSEVSSVRLEGAPPPNTSTGSNVFFFPGTASVQITDDEGVERI